VDKRRKTKKSISKDVDPIKETINDFFESCSKKTNRKKRRRNSNKNRKGAVPILKGGDKTVWKKKTGKDREKEISKKVQNTKG
jgi:hypothetical protein